MLLACTPWVTNAPPFIRNSLLLTITVSEMMQWRVQWESGKVSHFNRNIFKSDISDLKQEIQEFADTWISRLEELEKKQEQEISDLRNQENKVRTISCYSKEENGYDINSVN